MNTRKFTAGILSVVAALIMLSCNKPSTTTPSNRISTMVADWERAKKYTQAYLDSATDSTMTFKISENTPRSFGGQLLHMAEANYGLVKAATGKATDLGFGQLDGKEAYVTKIQISKAINDSYDYVIAAIQDLDDAKLDESITVELFPGFKPTMTREAMINKAFEHQTHHRGQTTQYLRAQGLTPPQEMLF